MNQSAGFFCVGPLLPLCAARKAAHFCVVVAALAVGRFSTVVKIRVVFEADPIGRGPGTRVSSAGARRRAHRLGVVESMTNVLGGGERKFARLALGEVAGTHHAPGKRRPVITRVWPLRRMPGLWARPRRGRQMRLGSRPLERRNFMCRERRPELPLPAKDARIFVQRSCPAWPA